MKSPRFKRKPLNHFPDGEGALLGGAAPVAGMSVGAGAFFGGGGLSGGGVAPGGGAVGSCCAVSAVEKDAALSDSPSAVKRAKLPSL